MIFSGSLPASISGSALFAEFVTGIKSAFTACGWAENASFDNVLDETDVASLDSLLGAVTSASYDQVLGYKIFQPSGSALQTTAPLFCRVEFRTAPAASQFTPGYPGTTPGYIPALNVQVAETIMQSGAVNSSSLRASISHLSYFTANAPATHPVEVWASGDPSRFVMVWGTVSQDAQNSPSIISIERTRNASGAPTDEGVIFMANSYGTRSYILFGGTGVAAFNQMAQYIPLKRGQAERPFTQITTNDFPMFNPSQPALSCVSMWGGGRMHLITNLATIDFDGLLPGDTYTANGSVGNPWPIRIVSYTANSNDVEPLFFNRGRATTFNQHFGVTMSRTAIRWDSSSSETAPTHPLFSDPDWYYCGGMADVRQTTGQKFPPQTRFSSGRIR